MSSSTTAPISPLRFAQALLSLPLSSLALKVAEIRNSIAHLDYSNEHLRPFAVPASGPASGGSTAADPVCVEAIAENEVVIARMQERLEMVKSEVERRGASWPQLAGFVPYVDNEIEVPVLAPYVEEEPVEVLAEEDFRPVNGVAGDGERRAAAMRVLHPVWTDGTFTAGRRAAGGAVGGSVSGRGQTTGGTLGDEELRRRLEERLGTEAEDEGDDAGMHL